jgi:hypothetical protein
MTYRNGATTVLGSIDTVDFTGIDWDVDEPRPEMKFGKPYLQLIGWNCTECRKQHGDDTVHAVTWVTKHYHATQPLGHLVTRCQTHQDHWVANPERGGARRISDVHPDERTAEENEWMASRQGVRQPYANGWRMSYARPAAPAFKASVCTSCFEELSRNGSCSCA